MAGYGNRTAPDISPDSLKEHHASTRLGLTDAHDVRPPQSPIDNTLLSTLLPSHLLHLSTSRNVNPLTSSQAPPLTPPTAPHLHRRRRLRQQALAILHHLFFPRRLRRTCHRRTPEVRHPGPPRLRALQQRPRVRERVHRRGRVGE